MEAREKMRYRAAALRGRRIYPGALGELVYRELIAYVEFGYRFSDDGLIPRLAAAIDHHADDRAKSEQA